MVNLPFFFLVFSLTLSPNLVNEEQAELLQLFLWTGDTMNLAFHLEASRDIYLTGFPKPSHKQPALPSEQHISLSFHSKGPLGNLNARLSTAGTSCKRTAVVFHPHLLCHRICQPAFKNAQMKLLFAELGSITV